MSVANPLSRTRALNELRGLVGRMVRVGVGGDPDGAPFGTVVLLGRLQADPEDRTRFYLGVPGIETASFVVPPGVVRGGRHQGYLVLMFGGMTIGVRWAPELEEAA